MDIEIWIKIAEEAMNWYDRYSEYKDIRDSIVDPVGDFKKQLKAQEKAERKKAKKEQKAKEKERRAVRIIIEAALRNPETKINTAKSIKWNVSTTQLVRKYSEDTNATNTGEDNENTRERVRIHQ